MLATEGPELSKEDDNLGMFILDGTWKLATVMENNLPLPPIKRSLPPLTTAYPRRQEQEDGLATVEALFAAYVILGRNVDGLLDNYYWKRDFIMSNDLFFNSHLFDPEAYL
ncbi:MAG: hypothetical protein S4CHLAM81_06350 [Chlamydiales bacterium]|nr:hypothetical protein [Chlamydiales bacterium]MCH9635419.1 hypothetical protein [Chlamydiales bacterium]